MRPLCTLLLLAVLTSPAAARGLVDYQRQALRAAQALKRAPLLHEQPLELANTLTPGKRILDHGGSKSLFKPPTPDVPHRIPAGTDHLRERGFFLTAAYLGLEAPVTALRRVGGRVGSVQAWTAGRAAVSALLEQNQWHDLYVPASKLARLDWDSVHSIAVLDYVTNNRDRHWGNILVQEVEGKLKLIPIDSGLCFAPRADWELKKASYELAIYGADHGGPRQLSAGLLARIQAVDEQRLARHLRRTGLEEPAVAEAIVRLGHVKREGLLALARHPVSGFPDYMAAAGVRALTPIGAAAQTPGPVPAATAMPVRTRFSSIFITTDSRF